MIQGVLFDMDGVILETERLGRTIFLEECARQGYPQIDEVYYQRLLGLSRAADRELMLASFGSDFPFEAVYDTYRERLFALAPAGQLPCRPHVAECFAGLKARGIRIALATSTARDIVNIYIRHIPEMQNVFDGMVCGGEVAHGKPAPDIYLAAAAAIGVPIENCIGVEDSPAGLRAITAAGCPSVFVPDLKPYDDSMAGTVSYEIRDLGQLCGLIDRINQ